MPPANDLPASPTGLILLAAGGSTRLGQPKQLLRFGGKTLLRRAAETARDSGCFPLIAVLGANADQMCSAFDGLPEVTLVENPEWQTGMGTSIRVGITALESLATVDAALVLLCDQPLLDAPTLRTLLATRAAGEFTAAVSVYANGASGPPCVFARSLFPALRNLNGPEGARQILRHLAPESIARVPFPEGDRDIDTPEDWARLQTVTAP